MKRLGLAVVVLTLWAPGVEAKPWLSEREARTAVTNYMKRSEGFSSYTLDYCRRATALRIRCAVTEYESTDGWASYSYSISVSRRRDGRISLRSPYAEGTNR